jgi:creatinine amidohydrolase
MAEEILYAVKGPKTLEDMTWEELSEVLKETDIVIVPVGSTEQHGPHLPLAADTIQVVELAKRTVSRFAADGVKMVAGPTIPFGVAPYHMPFPGTITLSADTLKAVITDVCKSLYRHGFRRFVLLLGHGGNYAVMQVAAQELVVDLPQSKVVFLNWLPALESRYPEFLLSGKSEGHSGEGETARVLLTHPNLVQMNRARVYYSKEADEAESEDHPLMGGGIFQATRDWKEVTPYGSVGNPTLATPETGEKAYDVIVDWITAAIKQTLLKN